MANINKEIQAFKDAEYGEDVRNSLIDVALKVNTECESTVAVVDKKLSDLGPLEVAANAAIENCTDATVMANEAADNARQYVLGDISYKTVELTEEKGDLESGMSLSKLISRIKDKFMGLIVANNLITNVEGCVLDARQGKVLSDSFDELNRNLDLTNSRRLWQRDYYLNAADINGTKDMLSVGTVDFYSGVSRNLFLNIQAADIAIWTGLPTTIAGFKIPWIGERLVMPRTSTGTAAAHIKLELREWYPVPGRVFTIFFNYGKWSAWNVVTPVKD